jgi:hypothetical protein
MASNPTYDQNNCGFCGNIHWWCVGCGYWGKVAAFVYLGYSHEDAKEEAECIRGECGEFVVCEVCNKNGDLPFIEPKFKY